MRGLRDPLSHSRRAGASPALIVQSPDKRIRTVRTGEGKAMIPQPPGGRGLIIRPRPQISVRRRKHVGHVV